MSHGSDSDRRKRQYDDNGAGPADPVDPRDKRPRIDRGSPTVWSVESILDKYRSVPACGTDQKLHSELASRDAKDILIPYNVVCDGAVQYTQPQLDAEDIAVHTRFGDLLERLKTLLPDCTPGVAFSWTEKYLPCHTSTIVQIVAILFGDWCTNKGFRHVKSKERVRVYLPRVQRDLGGFVDRGNITMVYTRVINSAVYNTSLTTLTSTVVDFVSSLLRLGYIGAGATKYLIPGPLSSRLVDKVVLQITGDARHIALPRGPLPRQSDIGLKETGIASRKVWAINKNTLEAPSSISEEYWISRLKTIARFPGETDAAFAARNAAHNTRLVGLIPQLIMSTPSVGVVPTVPSCRFYELDDTPVTPAIEGSTTRAMKFERAVTAVNAAVQYYVQNVHSVCSYEVRREWVVDQIFEFLHGDKWCPSFASNVCATYMQSTCVKLQDPEFREVDSAIPRAYFSEDPRYKEAATSEQRAVCAEYIRVLGHTQFPHSTLVVAMTGAPGSGKTTVSDVMANINGSSVNNFRIGGRYDNHTSGGVTTETTLVHIDDAFDAKSSDDGTNKPMVPPEIASAFFGRRADGVTQFTSNPKGVQPSTINLMPMSGLASVNKPALTGDGVDKVHQWMVCSGVGGSGAGRRSLSTPPSIYNMQKGTANPSQRGVTAYDPETLEGAHKPEHPFILILLWFAHTVGASGVSSDVYGLCGPTGNSLMTSLIEDFGSIKTVNILKICDELLVPEPDYVSKIPIPDTNSSLVTYRGVPLATLKTRIIEVAKKAIRPLAIPTKYNDNMAPAFTCTGCGLVVTGVGAKKMESTIDSIRHGAFAPPVMSTPCTGTVKGSCFDNLKRINVLRGYTMYNDSITDSGA